jgi:hypothetical protein
MAVELDRERDVLRPARASESRSPKPVAEGQLATCGPTAAEPP